MTWSQEVDQSKQFSCRRIYVKDIADSGEDRPHMFRWLQSYQNISCNRPVRWVRSSCNDVDQRDLTAMRSHLSVDTAAITMTTICGQISWRGKLFIHSSIAKATTRYQWYREWRRYDQDLVEIVPTSCICVDRMRLLNLHSFFSLSVSWRQHLLAVNL